MSSDDPVSDWIDKLRQGDAEAAQRIWDAYSQQLLLRTRQRMGNRLPTVSDEEDVVGSAFRSLFRRAAGGEFAELDGSDALWRLLVVIAERKALKVIRKERTQKRGGGKVVSASALSGDDPANATAWDQIATTSQTPEFNVAVAESVQQLLGLLEPESQSIAVYKLEGWTNEEIAAKLERSVKTIERRLVQIRFNWERAQAAWR